MKQKRFDIKKSVFQQYILAQSQPPNGKKQGKLDN